MGASSSPDRQPEHGPLNPTETTIPLRSHDEAILVLGPYDRYAKLLRQDLDIEIYTRKGNLRIKGAEEAVQEARRRIEHLLGKSRKGRELATAEVESIILGQENGAAATGGVAAAAPMPAPLRGRIVPPYRLVKGGEDPKLRAPATPPPQPTMLRQNPVVARSENQRRYLEMLERCPLTFGIGPAGTGKTYLAVAAAVKALRTGAVRRIVLSRPVVEAGERLGFLPGDVQQKLNPYTRPLYDAFYDMLGFEDVQRMEEHGIIEVAPLAFMRGRTLANAFVVLDEGQNATVPQMKMFLTRLGEGSRMVVTGDPTQTDLEERSRSGLADAVARLRGWKDVGLVEFAREDIVRHPLVEAIVRAYEAPLRRDEPRRDG
jgi:phosphate starvation-inducible PhoH-like protein